MKLRAYEVVISFRNMNRTNKLVVWAEDPEIAKAIALKWWGGPTEYAKLEARAMKKGEL